MKSQLRLLFIITFLTFLSKNTFAIKNLVYDVDSLKNELKNAKIDTVKAKLNFLIAAQLRSSDLAASDTYLSHGYELTKKSNWNQGFGKYYFTKGKNLGVLGKFEEAIQSFDSALYFYTSMNLHYEMAITYIFIGKCNSYLNKNSEAYFYYHKCLDFARENNLESEEFDCLGSIAELFSRMGQYEKAMETHQESLQLAKKIKNEEYIIMAKGNIGSTYNNLNQLDKGVEYLFEVVNHYEKTGNDEKLIPALINLGNAYGTMKNYDECLIHFKKALTLCQKFNKLQLELLIKKNLSTAYIKMENFPEAEKILIEVLEIYNNTKDFRGVASTYQIFGELYENQKKHQEALKYFYKALDAMNDLDNKVMKASILLNLGQTYYTLNDHKNALSSLTNAESLALISNQKSKLVDIYSLKHEIFASLGDHKNALENYKLYKIYSDSLNTDFQAAELEKTKFKYESMAKSNEIQQLKSEKELSDLQIQKVTQKKKFAILIGVLLLLITLLSSMFYIKQRNNKAKKKELELHLKSLRAQLNPHFIFNALASIHSYITSDNDKIASDYLIKYANLMRLFLKNSRNDFSDLDSEIQILKHYCDLEQARLKNSFDYKIQYDPNINLQNISIPSLIIQPFVENSIWHGISGLKDKRGLVEIIFEVKDNIIDISVKDNGLGRQELQSIPKKDKNDKKESFGIHLIKDRLDFISEKLKSQTSLNFIDLEEGLMVKLSVPFQSDFS